MESEGEAYWSIVCRSILWVMWVVFDHISNADVLVLVGYFMLLVAGIIYLAVVTMLVHRRHDETQNSRMRTSDEWKAVKTVEEVLDLVVRQGGFFKQKGTWANANTANTLAVNDKGRLLAERTRKRFSITLNSVVVIAVDFRTYSISFEDCVLALCLSSNVFLVVQLPGIEDVEKEKAEFLLLAKSVVGGSLGVPERRVLFCTTMVGRVAITRQLNPVLLIETDAGAVNQLAKHVRSTVLVRGFVEPEERRRLGRLGVITIGRYGEVFDISI